MFVFGGNEMIIGIFLANWMILTGIGTFIGNYMKKIVNNEKIMYSGLLFLSWLPPLMIFLISFLRNYIFKPGVETGFFQIAVTTAIYLTPFCFLSGFLFTILTKTILYKNHNIPAEQTYSFEAFGSLFAGIISSFILFYWFSNFQIIMLLTFLVSLILVFPLNNRLKYSNIIPVIVSATLITIMFSIRADYLIKELLFENQKVTYLKDTPYGNLAITKSDDQINVYENGKLLFSTDNQISNEESVHYAMSQHPEPKDILLISGGISGITREILKYNINRVDYVEINPAIFYIGKKFTTSLNDKRINTIRHDARIYIHKTKSMYDVILINLPEPSTAELNRYYTIEFLSEIKRILNKNGIIMMSLPSTANYINNEAIQLNSVIYNTCKKVFEYVLIIPGERNYFLASDMSLTVFVTQFIESKMIETIYLNSYYIDDSLLLRRSDYLMENLNPNTLINKDFRPVSYFYYLGYWLSQFNLSEHTLWVIFFVLLAVILAVSIIVKPVTSAIMITGFSASAIEIILLLGLQIIFGYIYQVIGICVAIFMGGLALGALCRKRIFRKVNFIQFVLLQFAIGITAVIIPVLLFMHFFHLHEVISMAIILILLFLVSFLTGLLFSLSVQLREGDLAGNVATLYSSDLIGSAMGAFITSVFLIPLSGLLTTSYLIGILNVVFASYLLIREKRI
jgi:spermidine synthase